MLSQYTLTHSPTYLLTHSLSDQYFFIHEAVAEAVACGLTEVKSDMYPQYLEMLEHLDGGEQLEFRVRCLCTCNCLFVICQFVHCLSIIYFYYAFGQLAKVKDE